MRETENSNAEMNLQKTDKISKHDKFLMYLPIIILAVAFAVVFGIIGYYVDESIFGECIGRNHLSSIVGFAFAGVCVSLIFSVLLPNSVYKLFIKKDEYDEFMRMVNAQEIQGPAIYKVLIYAFIIIACLAIATFFTCMFCFNGVAFTQSSIVYKEYAFSKMEEYSFENTDMAIIEGSYSDGEYSEYGGTAYAFKLGDEWYDYGIADNEASSVIESNIAKYNKDVKVYKSVEDIR